MTAWQAARQLYAAATTSDADETQWGISWAGVRWVVRPLPWRPPTDVFETPEALVVRVEVAGMRPGDFEITLQEQVLRIRGVRHEPDEVQAYYQMEIPFGAFEVLVRLPPQVPVEDTEAEYRDGFLTVRLRKARPVRVPVGPARRNAKA